MGEGELKLDAEGLHFEGTKSGEAYSFFVPIKQLPTYGMCTDCLLYTSCLSRTLQAWTMCSMWRRARI